MAAIAKVVPYHIRTKPDNKKLRDFYVLAKAFERGPREPGADVAATTKGTRAETPPPSAPSVSPTQSATYRGSGAFGSRESRGAGHAAC